ncbi:unnamed protein product [Rotaria socialis]|uniref:Uncharacterized protein n=6 Tax=Rotaria socialis TaxID=392032 RepID=A0A818A7K8_9BILA|nr:unnamed protein product [Rotaria socialis]CAF3335194.1 unnamed protein product [Rotaria socialis]CAF3403520.1 unnamed protein product [Rotaria socialis]CAF3545857.1 unnamed protein product [Rotaria socialis]CAF3570421.1 unnamed protein product [Rotaria socialis]
MGREIVTLQIGNDSNNVGTELWNQLDVEHTHDNTLIDYNTYYTFNKKTNVPSPRVLIIDYRNTFGTLFNEKEPNVKSPENTSSIEIVNREIDDNFWSKNLKTKAKFNRKSLIPLIDYWYYSSNHNEENQFDIYPIGQQIYKKMFDQIEHSLHYLLESCDSLQSFRCLYDVNDSFSGLFTSMQDYLVDECPKKPIWSFGIGDRPSSLNLSMSVVHSLVENQMPTIPCLSSNKDKSKLSLSIQHSLLHSNVTLDLLADRLCPMKKHFLKLFSKIPLDLHDKTLHNYLDFNDIFRLEKPLACHYFIRGIEQKQLYNQDVYNFNIQTSAELIATYLREQYGTKMFLSTDSWIEKYDHMSFITGLFNDDSYSLKFFENLKDDLKKINYKTVSKRWEENEFDEQMFEQLMNNLNTLHEQYQ